MFQQLFALIIIIYFVFRLFLQKKRKKITRNEFVFWMIFWLFSSLAIVFIKKIDLLVAKLGFSASGIDVLLYFGFAILFYMVFRLRLKIERVDRDMTVVVREIAIMNNKNNNKKPL